MSLGKCLATGNYKFYTCWYWLCNICLSITSIVYYFRITIWNLEGNQLPRAKKWQFSTPQLSKWWAYCLCQGNPMTSSRKPLSSGNYDFYTHQYWLYNINFPVISTQNHHSKRIMIPGCECIYKYYMLLFGNSILTFINFAKFINFTKLIYVTGCLSTHCTHKAAWQQTSLRYWVTTRCCIA